MASGHKNELDTLLLVRAVRSSSSHSVLSFCVSRYVMQSSVGQGGLSVPEEVVRQ